MPSLTSYIGRFAPSPSGPLHFGSLIAAVGSYLQAKSSQGKWLVRMEDIDTPRMQQGADSDILKTLESFELYWDDTVIYQSDRLERYQDIFSTLAQQNLVYGCQCNRKQISALNGIYNNQCRNLALQGDNLAWRIISHNVKPSFHDLIFGHQEISTALCNENYIIKRRDGLFAYQFVVVVDDIDQRVSEVIRGADLLQMTPRQEALCQLLGYKAPRYGHLPLAVIEPGFKLSKQNHASAISQWPKEQTLTQVLHFLNHEPPKDLQAASISEQLSWAIANWQLSKVPSQLEINSTEFR